MEYTKHCEDLLWAVWGLDSVESESEGNEFQFPSTNEKEYQRVFEILDTEFRTFGTGLIDLMNQKAGHSVDDPIQYLKAACLESGIDSHEIGNDGTLRNWFNRGLRPKKSEDSRHKMFVIAFALKLTVNETKEMFHKVYLDRAFDQRKYQELIYYYCLGKDLSYREAKSIIARVQIDNSVTTDVTMNTVMIAENATLATNEDELLDFIHCHGHNFSKKSESVKRSIQHLKKKAQEFVAAERSAVYECDKVEGKIKNGIYDKNSSWKNSLHYDKIEKSDSNLYSVIIGRHVKGRTGTGIISFKNSVLPKEISSNFPQIKSLSESIDSYEELRKVLILLFSYCFWSEGTPEEGNDYDEYIIRLNLLLQEANMSPLYFGNPFDWLFMYCALNNHPLDAFRGILEEVLSND